MPRKPIGLTLDLSSDETDPYISPKGKTNIYTDPYLQNLFETNSVCVNVDGRKIIGKGASGKVYEIQWAEIKEYFLNNNLASKTSICLDDDSHLVLKLISPVKEIEQRFSSLDLPREVLEKYIYELNTRCTRIYQYIIANNYFNIPQHICRIYGCGNCSHTNGEVNHGFPSLMLALEKLKHISLDDYIKLGYLNKENLVENVSLLILQVIFITVRLSQYHFYHNDLNLGNVMVKNTNVILKVVFPWNQRSIKIRLNNQPIVKLIDFDLASLDYPLNNTFEEQTSIEEPVIDIYYFVMNLRYRLNFIKNKTKRIRVFLERLDKILSDFFDETLGMPIRAVLEFSSTNKEKREKFIRKLVNFCIFNIGQDSIKISSNVIKRSKSLSSIK